ncbi:MAG: hypothetical protein ACOCUF_02055 [Patescibacteria group bacterium]
MNNKIIIFAILFILFIAIFFVFFKEDNNHQTEVKKSTDTKGANLEKRSVANSPDAEKIKVAACPTCFEMVKNVKADKYEIIKTRTTAESIALLENGQADVIMAGRTLKPGEPKLAHLSIGEGYSFLSSQTKTILAGQLNDYDIYTDLETEGLEKKLSVEKIQKVDNIYEYLDKGIIITSWENTDYTKASIVHVLEKDNKRMALSRRPAIYCPGSCESPIVQELAKDLKK